MMKTYKTVKILLHVLFGPWRQMKVSGHLAPFSLGKGFLTYSAEEYLAFRPQLPLPIHMYSVHSRCPMLTKTKMCQKMSQNSTVCI
jgi:hypothetical protein